MDDQERFEEFVLACARAELAIVRMRLMMRRFAWRLIDATDRMKYYAAK